MAHISSRLHRVLIALSAVTGLTVAMSTPARSETVDLICNYETNDSVLRVYLDTTQRSVVIADMDDKRMGPFVASITDTLIRWIWRGITGNDAGWEYQYTIDRVAGTIRDHRFYRDAEKADLRGKCRRATQKF